MPDCRKRMGKSRVLCRIVEWHEDKDGDSGGILYAPLSGLVAARYDDLVDLNCQSAREQLTCHIADCRENLQRFKQPLLDRRDHE